VEQTGPVRAVVKLEGVHKAETGAREWLPFTVRLYFYAGLEQVRLVHTIVFDGDDQKDFIRGLGVAFSVPMREQIHNRHVRFSGEGDGLWSEPIEPASARPLMLPGAATPTRSTGGQAHPQQRGLRPARAEAAHGLGGVGRLQAGAVHGRRLHHPETHQSAKLLAERYRRKARLRAGLHRRRLGGLAVGVKNFWQSYPASLEIQKASTEAADLYVWLWSPDAAAMDLRHYDTKAHGLDSSYEDVQPGFSTPHGVARSSEMTLFPSAAVPAKEDLARQAHLAVEPPCW